MFTIVDGILVEYHGPGGVVVVPEDVIEIGKGAFSREHITSISFPNGLKAIREVAFSECNELTEIIIPESVDVIESFAFSFCERLRKVALPTNLSKLSAGAFYYCESLTSISLPTCIDTIEESLLASCKRLESVAVPAGVKTIKARAFSNCSSLQRVVLPKGLERICNHAFDGCSSLEDLALPDSVSIIEYNAFERCYNLRNINRPSNLTEFGEHAFYGCENLGAYFADEKGMFCVGTQLYQYFGNSPVVTIPDGIKILGQRAFANNQTLQKIVFPKSLEVIGIAAFLQCSNLERVDLPDGLTTIGSNAFYKCTNLKSINIPGSVTSIGRDFLGFCPCEVHLQKWSAQCSERFDGNWVKRINVEDFSTVPSKYKLPIALNFIRENNKDLSSDRAKAHLKYLSANAVKVLEPAFTHPEFIVFLCENRLIKAKDIDLFLDEVRKWKKTKVLSVLEEYAKELGDDVRNARTKKETVADTVAARLAKRDPADGILGLSFYFVGRTPSYRRVWENRSEINEYLVHYGAKTAKTVNSQTDYVVILDEYEPSAALTKEKANQLGIKVLKEDEFNILVGKRFEDLDHITVPAWMDHIPAEGFNSMDGLDHRNLQSVVLPDTIKSIGRGAFWHCQYLREITIPDGVTEIAPLTFTGCSSLKKVVLPKSIRTIGSRAFWGCKELEDIVVPEGAKIGESAFGGCEALVDQNGFVIINGDLIYSVPWGKKVEVPENVKRINGGVFYEGRYPQPYNEPVEEIIFPEGLISIGDSAFACCRKMTSITLPDGLESIENYSFSSCNELKKVWIPSSVTSIGENAFMKCKKLRIYTPAGSYAEQFAKGKRIRFTPCDHEAFLK